jgi:hypothetical protein
MKQTGDMDALSNSWGMFTLLLPLNIQLANCNSGVTTSKTITKKAYFTSYTTHTINVTQILRTDLQSVTPNKGCLC